LEPEYYATQTKSGAVIQFIGWLVAAIMAIGSSFAAMNTMYAAVAYRSREIATLRVIGFSRPSILTSFVLEALLLSLLGAVVGIVLMLPFNGMSTGVGNQVTFSETVFSLQMTWSVVLTAIIFALVMGLLGGIAMIWILGMVVLTYRVLASDTPEVEVVRATAEGDDVAGATVLAATGYVVAHHKINVNSKVTGRVAWIGVEKGDKVKEGQILVRLENQEFLAQYQQAKGAVESTRARLNQLEHGSRPEEVQQAQHNLDEARATLANDRLTLNRTKDLVAQGVLSRQALDDDTAKFESSQQRVHSLEQGYQLSKIGPRHEEIDRARGDLAEAQGRADFAKAQLDATIIRAPVNGTILERTAEKGDLITAQFASSAEGGPQGSVVSLADLTDLQVELDIAQDDFSKLSRNQKGVVSVDAFPDRKYDGTIH